jgi:hypothetical protein
MDLSIRSRFKKAFSLYFPIRDGRAIYDLLFFRISPKFIKNNGLYAFPRLRGDKFAV